MLVEKMWITKRYKYNILVTRKTWRGWFLFGILPLFVKMIKLETLH